MVLFLGGTVSGRRSGEPFGQLPDGAIVEALPGLRVKGKESLVDAYILRALP
jgi:hypothetical protein